MPPVRLALGRKGLDAGPYALWTLYEKLAPLEFDYVLGGGVADTRERRFREKHLVITSGVGVRTMALGDFLGGFGVVFPCRPHTDRKRVQHGPRG